MRISTMHLAVVKLGVFGGAEEWDDMTSVEREPVIMAKPDTLHPMPGPRPII